VACRIEYDVWFRRQVQVGIDEAARGQTISHEELVRRAKVRRAYLIAKSRGNRIK
jgi:hypothetical protein